MQDKHELQVLLQGDHRVLVLESREESRLLTLLSGIAMELGDPLFRWSVTEGLRRADVDYDVMTSTQDPEEVLRHIHSVKNPGMYALLDFHPYLEDPRLVRWVKEIALDPRATRRRLLLISHELGIPPEITHLSVRYQPSLPDPATLRRLVKEEASAWRDQRGHKLKADPDAVEDLIRNLSGVSHSEARGLVRHAIADGAITCSDLPKVMKAKHELLARKGPLHLEHATEDFAQVAGLSKLKAWLQERREAFIEGDASIDPARGVLLLGIQGGGKSLAAKAIAGLFNVPLLRLDMGALYDKYIGETEKRLRQGLEAADMMSPCVLWIDEIEKGISSGDSDQGTSKRVLGAVLTWMAERKHRVFVTATANDISQLPPELLRKGRFDEIFFVDLPDPEVRREIFAIHLAKRALRSEDFELATLADASEGFSGAEIEQAVVSAIYGSRSSNSPTDTSAVLDALGATRPLSVMMAEQMQALRSWAMERTVSAH